MILKSNEDPTFTVTFLRGHRFSRSKPVSNYFYPDKQNFLTFHETAFLFGIPIAAVIPFFIWSKNMDAYFWVCTVVITLGLASFYLLVKLAVQKRIPTCIRNDCNILKRSLIPSLQNKNLSHSSFLANFKRFLPLSNEMLKIQGAIAYAGLSTIAFLFIGQTIFEIFVSGCAVYAACSYHFFLREVFGNHNEMQSPPKSPVQRLSSAKKSASSPGLSVQQFEDCKPALRLSTEKINQKRLCCRQSWPSAGPKIQASQKLPQRLKSKSPKVRGHMDGRSSPSTRIKEEPDFSRIGRAKIQKMRPPEVFDEEPACTEDSLERHNTSLFQAHAVLDNHELMPGTFVKYHVTITLGKMKWSVWHRYSEFRKLHADVSKEVTIYYPPHEHAESPVKLLPVVPSRYFHIWNDTSEASIQRKKETLQEMLQVLLSHTEFCDLDNVRDFLGVLPLPASLKTYPKAASDSVRTEDRCDVLPGVSKIQQSHQLSREEVFSDTHPALFQMFSDSSTLQEFKVRGQTYMDDKIKVPAGPAAFKLLHVDLFKVPNEAGRIDHIASTERVKAQIQKVTEFYNEAFLFILNFQVPGNPRLNMVTYSGVPEEFLEVLSEDRGTATAQAMFERFLDLPDDLSELDPGKKSLQEFQNKRFKLFPSVVKGPWVCQRAVRNKPAILGQKITQRYFQSEQYVETDLDISSSIIANNIVGLCRGYAVHLVVDIGIALEGLAENELPEKLLTSIRLSHLNMDTAVPLF